MGMEDCQDGQHEEEETIWKEKFFRVDKRHNFYCRFEVIFIYKYTMISGKSRQEKTTRIVANTK